MRSTFLSRRYSYWLRAYRSGLSLICPLIVLVEQNRLGESKAGRHSQSTLHADLCRRVQVAYDPVVL